MIGMTREQHLAEICVEMAGPVTEDADVAGLLHRLTEHCVELLDVTAAGTLLMDETGTPRTVAASDEHARLLGLFALHQKQGPCAECCRTGAGRSNVDLAYVEGTVAWPRFAARARATGYVRTHAVPLRLRDRTIGALTLFQTTAHRLGDDDSAVARGLADLVTISILRQRALKRSRALTGQLAGALTSRIVIEQVKGVLSERWNTTSEEAFAALRAYVRTRHLRLSDVAGGIVTGAVDTSVIPAPVTRHGGHGPPLPPPP
ncbi:GAF domain-containing protein [Streptomyces sp. SID8379]|nr:GAF domain-containing protein [Streptomyces sp. SID8379]